MGWRCKRVTEAAKTEDMSVVMTGLFDDWTNGTIEQRKAMFLIARFKQTAAFVGIEIGDALLLISHYCEENNHVGPQEGAR